ncbi:hypothetical protein [Pseudotenacibaculum haliotis]|uniref:SF3 helicase domain-containing protein n=1 Tax=Pseudotenacibaculum haliotis TaxID=1862138 RepID=A0ABW5LZC7_9FLAO
MYSNLNPFWSTDENGKIKISQNDLTNFLGDSGFSKVKNFEGRVVLVREYKNIVREVTDDDVIDFIVDFLRKQNKKEVLEIFSKGVSGFINKSKLKLLDTTTMIIDKDSKSTSMFYFKNLTCQVGVYDIRIIPYEKLDKKIWVERIIPNNYFPYLTNEKSQFEQFCFNISGQDEKRFKALKTNIGYLLHRFQDSKNTRAVIFVDQEMSSDGRAHGGTGKTLLMDAIGVCREVVTISGKDTKSSSNFKNQRVSHTSDIVFYDDVKQGFNFEELYSTITSGMVIEQKQKKEFYLPLALAPKIVISSNYYVKGTGGNTDSRRRCEFELSSYYNEKNKPDTEFGNRFFDDWDDYQWSLFYKFMMECTQVYLREGLIIAEPINLVENELISSTSIEFYQFVQNKEIKENEWISKKETKEDFVKEYPNHSNISSHQFTKWMKVYALSMGLIYEDRKSGKNYQYFMKSRKEVSDGK